LMRVERGAAITTIPTARKGVCHLFSPAEASRQI